MKGTLILLVVMFGAGLGLGYLLGNSQDTITRAEPARSATRPAPGADDLVVPEGGYRSLGDAIGAVPALRGETGHGIITGKVTNEEGDPIAGAVIRASQRFASSWRGTTWQVGDGAPEPRSLETQVRTFIARQKRVERAGREAVTDADGNYQLDDLADAEYTLAAYARGYKIEPAAGQRRNKARPGETVDFTAAAVVEIPITLQMPGGASTEGVSISTRNLDNQRTEWRSWNARRSSLRVKPGHYEISASKGNELKSHKVELTAEFGVPVEPIVLTLHGRPGIRGRIIFEEGELMGWTQVRLLRMTGAKMPRAARLRKHGKRASAHVGGEYSFPDLKPGRYVLGVEIGSRVVGLTQVEVEDRVVEQDIRLGAFDPAEFVVIHVFDPKGKRITDAKFSTSFESGNASSSGGGTAVRRKDGGYYVPHHDSSNIDAGG
ncbi:MAG: carboxypeptidase-like regulatory domain-containing protein, partial [Planctomycetota bacterium]|nr:carboxypeptidase-like regulatory domain-containing protein [Planctomycetota bacterium]